MKRFGFAIRVGGDPEISGAIADGIRKGSPDLFRQPFGLPPSPKGEGKATSDAVRRAAMWQHSPEEWAHMTEEARVIYGGRRYMPRWAERLLVVYAMLCYGVSQAYRAQDRVLGTSSATACGCATFPRGEGLRRDT